MPANGTSKKNPKPAWNAGAVKENEAQRDIHLHFSPATRSVVQLKKSLTTPSSKLSTPAAQSKDVGPKSASNMEARQTPRVQNPTPSEEVVSQAPSESIVQANTELTAPIDTPPTPDVSEASPEPREPMLQPLENNEEEEFEEPEDEGIRKKLDQLHALCIPYLSYTLKLDKNIALEDKNRKRKFDLLHQKHVFVKQLLGITFDKNQRGSDLLKQVQDLLNEPANIDLMQKQRDVLFVRIMRAVWEMLKSIPNRLSFNVGLNKERTYHPGFFQPTRGEMLRNELEAIATQQPAR